MLVCRAVACSVLFVSEPLENGAAVMENVEHTESVVEVTLPRRFYGDHVERDLPAGTVISRTIRTVRVQLDRNAYDELLADARHYSGEAMAEYATDGGQGLISSARATVRRLLAVPRPALAGDLDTAHAEALEENEAHDAAAAVAQPLTVEYLTRYADQPVPMPRRLRNQLQARGVLSLVVPPARHV